MALLLTGRPGVGKTTALRAAAERLAEFDLVGFFTEDIRVGRERRGFRLVTFDGHGAVIAHVDLPPPRVSKYGVDVQMLDRSAAALLRPARPSTAYIVDEIGKMECMSRSFIVAVTGLLERQAPLVATIAQRGGGFIETVKQRGDIEMWTVTETTREALPDRVAEWVRRRVGPMRMLRRP